MRSFRHFFFWICLIVFICCEDDVNDGKDESSYTDEQKFALLTRPTRTESLSEILERSEKEKLSHHNGYQPDEEGKFHITDMGLRLDQIDYLYGEGAFGISKKYNRTKRTATKPTVWQWPKGIIIYDFQYGHFDDREQREILAAMRVWEQHTCIKFRQIKRRNAEKNYLNIMRSLIYCKADLGFPGIGKVSRMLFRDDCMVFGQYLHELGHVLGLVHEHNLPQRDRYITIHPANIIAKYEAEFTKYASHAVMSYDNEYDLSSVMHYEHNSFAVNPTLSSFSVPDKWMLPFIGRLKKRRLSFSDIKFVNNFYRCSAKCPAAYNNRCAPRGGYVNSHCSCHTAIDFYRSYCTNNPAWESQCYELAVRGLCDPKNEVQHKNCAKACMLCPRFMPGQVVAEVPSTACRNVYPETARCRAWASLGLCKTSKFVRRYCTFSCQLCADDKFPNCPNLLLDQSCDTFAAKLACRWKLPTGELARTLCQSSCNTCSYRPRGKCENKRDDEWCKMRTDFGECDTLPLVMFKECPASCNRCWFNAGGCANTATEETCEVWAAKNRCTSGDYENEMGKKCKKTCNSCEHMNG